MKHKGGNEKMDLLESTIDNIRPYIKDNSSQIDFTTIRGNSQVILLGDTDHRQTHSLAGITKQIYNLKESGVKYLAFELPTSYNNCVNEFNKSGDLALINEIAEKTRTPIRVIRLFKTAYEADMPIYLIDMPEEKIKKSWSHNKATLERSLYMGEEISRITKEEGVGAVICGYGHIYDKHIPSKLKKNNISFKRVALVTAGQPQINPILRENEYGFMTANPSQAVADCKKQNESIFVNLNNNYVVDGFIHFPKFQLIEGLIVREIKPENTKNDYAITCLENMISIPPTTFDFKKEVEPSCHGWESSNWKKIVNLTSTIESLTNGQRLYLSTLLENYVRKTMHHGGGSIVTVEFDPESKAFAVDTVDTFGYKYNENGDYGSLARHREVTISSLIKNFGLEKEITGIKDVSDTDIEPKNNSLENSFKLALLIAYSLKSPENISVGDSIYIYPNKDKISGTYIAKIDLDEFKLSDLESEMMKLNWDIRLNFMPNLSLLTFKEFLDEDKYFDCISSIIFPKISEAILISRAKLSYLDSEKAVIELENIKENLRTYEKIYDKNVSIKNNVERNSFSRDAETPISEYELKEMISNDKKLCKKLDEDISKLINIAKKK